MKNLKKLLGYANVHGTEREDKETLKLFKAWFKEAKLTKPEENVNYMDKNNEYGMIPGDDNYTHMEGLKTMGWIVLSSLGDRPYVWYAISPDKTRLLQYIEGDIKEREVH